MSGLNGDTNEDTFNAQQGRFDGLMRRLICRRRFKIRKPVPIGRTLRMESGAKWYGASG